MANNRVNEVSFLINQQIASQEVIREYLLKAEAAANVALCEGFFNCKQSVIHAYLWGLCDTISKAKILHESALSDLLRYSKQNWILQR